MEKIPIYFPIVENYCIINVYGLKRMENLNWNGQKEMRIELTEDINSFLSDMKEVKRRSSFSGLIGKTANYYVFAIFGFLGQSKGNIFSIGPWITGIVVVPRG